MCGEYIYFGVKLGRWDEREDGGEIIVDSNLIKLATDKYNKFIKDNPKVDKILKRYEKKDPQLFIMQQKW